MTLLLLADDDVFIICPPPPLELLYEDSENAERDKSEAICSPPPDFKDDTVLDPPSEIQRRGRATYCCTQIVFVW